MNWNYKALVCAIIVIPSLRCISQARASQEQLFAKAFIPSDIDLWNFYRIVPSSQPSSSLATSPGSVFTPPRAVTLEETSYSATQFWYLDAIPDGQQTRPSANDSNHYYRLRTVVTGPCCSLGVLDEEAGTVGVGRGLGGPTGEWAITRVDGKPGQWQIVSNGVAWSPTAVRRRLGVAGAGTDAGVEVRLAESGEVDGEALSWQVLAVVRRVDSPRC